MRQQGQATRVACSSISESSAIESARKPNSAASEFRLSRQWWMDEKNEWGLGHLMAPVQRQGASRAVADWRPRILSRADLSGAQQPAADSRSGFHVTNVPSIMKSAPPAAQAFRLLSDPSQPSLSDLSPVALPKPNAATWPQ